MSDVMQLIAGRWVPAIPEPYPLLARLRCACGRKFWKRANYARHYATQHITPPAEPTTTLETNE